MIYLHATNAWGVIGLKTSHREREIEIKTLQYTASYRRGAMNREKPSALEKIQMRNEEVRMRPHC